MVCIRLLNMEIFYLCFTFLNIIYFFMKKILKLVKYFRTCFRNYIIYPHKQQIFSKVNTTRN